MQSNSRPCKKCYNNVNLDSLIRKQVTSGNRLKPFKKIHSNSCVCFFFSFLIAELIGKIHTGELITVVIIFPQTFSKNTLKKKTQKVFTNDE